MKYIFSLFFFTAAISMHGMDTPEANFFSYVANGEINNIAFSNVSQNLTDWAIYVASKTKQYQALEFLLMGKANTASIPAQLALIQGLLNRDIKLCNLLQDTPRLPADVALYYAVIYDQFELVEQLAKQIAVDPKYLGSDFLKLAYADADLQGNQKITAILSQHKLPEIQIAEALTIACNYNCATPLLEKFLYKFKPTLKTLLILYNLVQLTKTREIEALLLAYANETGLTKHPRINSIKREAL